MIHSTVNKRFSLQLNMLNFFFMNGRRSKLKKKAKNICVSRESEIFLFLSNSQALKHKRTASRTPRERLYF